MRTEDGYIIHKCLNGESAAFGLLVDKYKASIFALAYFKLQNFHDAEDITQEVFLKAYRKLRTLKRWDNFLAWLYAITANLCTDLIRSRSKRPDLEFIADQDSGLFSYTSINSYQNEQKHESLYEALASLPEIYRQVLTFYYFGGMSSVEIARFLGMSPNTVDKRLSRARAKLKKEMLDMMSKTYDQQKLQPGFTFRIVEMVKRIKIKPAPSKPLLPLGLSAATGIVLTVMMFSPHLISLTPLGALLGSPLPSETKVMAVGELPVDVLEISEITFLSSQQDGNDGAPQPPNPQNAFAPPLAPAGEGGWTKKTEMPTLRGATAVGVVNGKIYVIGGGVDIANTLSTVEEYDPVTNTWTRKADMPTARGSGSASVVNGKIYVIGGCANNMVSLSTVEEYDPATNTWTKKSDMPSPRVFLSTSVVNGKIYAIGGIVALKPNDFFSTVEEYNPTTDTWTRKSDMPTPRAGLSTSTVDGKIYAIGGEAPKGQNMQGWNMPTTVEEYDPVTDTWMRKSDMPTPRWALSTISANGRIYAIGGGDLNGKKVLPTMEIYDPKTDTWIKEADMPFARAGISTATMNGKIYAIGGATQLLIWGMQAVPVVPNVDVYDTGFRPSGINMKGKLPTTWGDMKSGK